MQEGERRVQVHYLQLPTWGPEEVQILQQCQKVTLHNRAGEKRLEFDSYKIEGGERESARAREKMGLLF
jgi:hypothetical protein